MNEKVDAYLGKVKKWRTELEMLRKICLDCGLEEEVKWGKPCYTFGKGNVVIIIGFKAYCALMFFKGALLNDPEGLLVRAGEHTQAARQLRFGSSEEIRELESSIKAYVQEAVAVEKAGLQVELKKPADFAVPEELQSALDADPNLQEAFSALTPGRQRAYLMYFGSAKQAKTRTSRVEKHIPRIMAGKGMDDR